MPPALFGKSDVQIKLAFELDDTKWHGVSVETMWATPRGSSSAILDSVPFFAQGVSYRDVVTITQDSDHSWHFRKVLTSSGHSTYRIRFYAANESLVHNLISSELKEAGCIVERGAHGGFLIWAISIPPTSNADSVYRLLDAAAIEGTLEIEEGNDVHPE